MKIMASLLRQGRFADEIMQMNISPNTPNVTARTKVGRNDPCPVRKREKVQTVSRETVDGAVLQQSSLQSEPFPRL
jgi:hypothetical protein